MCKTPRVCVCRMHVHAIFYLVPVIACSKLYSKWIKSKL